MLKLAIAAMFLLSSSANADEIRELSNRMQDCITEPDPNHAGSRLLKFGSGQVIIGSTKHLYIPPNVKTSPDGLLVAGLIGHHITWLTYVDINVSPPKYYETHTGNGPLFRQVIPTDVHESLIECGFEFGGARPEPIFDERQSREPNKASKQSERTYPEFHLPKIDWD